MIKLNNSYLGFTNGIKPMQAAKQEKSLDMLVRYNDQVMKEKEYVIQRLSEGYIPAIEENHQHYKKNGELTKPKTLYKLEKENGYCEVNKTLYNFATYILDNDFLNEEKVNEYLINEQKEKEEKERLQAQKEEKERQEREEKARIQREKDEAERKIKIDNWSKIGNKLMTEENVKLIKETIQDYFTKISATEEEKENFVNSFISSMPQKLGNAAFLKSNIEYYLGKEEEDKNYFHPMNIEGEIFVKLFNIESTDHIRTIGAKINAVYNNSEYKGSNKKPVVFKEFYIFNKGEGYKKETGQEIKINGLTCFIYEKENGLYAVTEARTGLLLGIPNTNKKEVIQASKQGIEKAGERLERLIQSHISNNGISPLYEEKTA